MDCSSFTNVEDETLYLDDDAIVDNEEIFEVEAILSICYSSAISVFEKIDLGDSIHTKYVATCKNTKNHTCFSFGHSYLMLNYLIKLQYQHVMFYDATYDVEIKVGLQKGGNMDFEVIYSYTYMWFLVFFSSFFSYSRFKMLD